MATQQNTPFLILGQRGLVAACLDMGNARYHLWVDQITGQAVDNKLYRNPLPSTFDEADVRVFSQDGDFSDIADRLKAAVGELLPAFRLNPS